MIYFSGTVLPINKSVVKTQRTLKISYNCLFSMRYNVLVDIMKNWMKALSSHYATMQKTYADQTLLIVFDIDDTIVDTRYAIKYLLHKYDAENTTNYFSSVQLKEIKGGFWDGASVLQLLLNKYNVPSLQVISIIHYIESNFWNHNTIFASHKPFQGVLEIIRWFQLQKNTAIALNTGRSEKLREVTLRSLNMLGKEYRVTFTNEMLYMNPESDTNVEFYKVQGIEHFQTLGFKVIAMLDNEPANLQAIQKSLNDPDILLLHAYTRFISPLSMKPEVSVDGDKYDISELITEDLLPSHIAFVWNGMNNKKNLRKYLESNVNWAELDVRRLPTNGQIVLYHDSIESSINMSLTSFETMLKELLDHHRKIKLVFKEDEQLLFDTIRILQNYKIADSHLWFHLLLDRFSKESIQRIHTIFPNAIVSVVIDYIIPVMQILPERSVDVLNTLKAWGINRFSISWMSTNKAVFVEKMQQLGMQYSFRDVSSLDSFLHAVLLQPIAITSNFYFPKWQYYGLGDIIIDEIQTKK